MKTESDKAISENISEKRKRGRPRTHQRTFIEALPESLQPNAKTMRSKMDHAFSMAALTAVTTADADTQRAVWGCTEEEIRAGTGHFPKGWQGAAVEAGRFLEATGADADETASVARTMADARKRGLSFRDIAVHYRRLRLGKREGNALSLTTAIARTIDDYRRRFPLTTQEQTSEALRSVLAFVENQTGTA